MICIFVCWVVNCFRNVPDDSCYSDLTSDVIRLVNTRLMGRCRKRRKERKKLKTIERKRDKQNTTGIDEYRVMTHKRERQKEKKRERK